MCCWCCCCRRQRKGLLEIESLKGLRSVRVSTAALLCYAEVSTVIYLQKYSVAQPPMYCCTSISFFFVLFRRLGDVTNSSTTRLNDHLGGGGNCNTPCGAKTKEGRIRTTPGYGGCDSSASGTSIGNGIQEMSIDVSRGVGRSRTSSRRVSSRTGQTPVRQTVAARTRSRVSLAPVTSSLRGVR